MYEWISKQIFKREDKESLNMYEYEIIGREYLNLLLQ
jgi:hypothetical protein